MIPQLLPSGWEKGAPRRASSSNPSCLSNCAPEPLNPRPNTVRSGTVQARALTRDEDAQVQVKTRIGQNAPGLFSATTGMKASDPGFLLGHLTSNLCSGLRGQSAGRPGPGMQDMRVISRWLKPRHGGSEEISGAGVGKRSRQYTGPSPVFYMGSGSRRSHILFSQPGESGWDAQVFTKSPQLERRNPQPLGPLTQNPPPAKAHAPLPRRPGPQAAQGAPLSSASGSSRAQLKLVRR